MSTQVHQNIALESCSSSARLSIFGIEYANELVILVYIAIKFDFELNLKKCTLSDCWQWRRNEETRKLEWDIYKFPCGLDNLGSFLHKRRLKFGLYANVGPITCRNRPGNYKLEVTTVY